MRKPIDKTSAILPMVYSARKKQLKFPSKAKDQGSSKRNAKYLTQILLNKINGSQETSDKSQLQPYMVSNLIFAATSL